MTRPTFSRRAIVAAGLAGAAGLTFGQAGPPVRIGRTLALTGPLASSAQLHRLVGDIYGEQLKKRVLPDPFEGVFAFQPVTLAQPTTCAKCQKRLVAGMSAHLGLTDTPPRKPQDRRFACDACVPH